MKNASILTPVARHLLRAYANQVSWHLRIREVIGSVSCLQKSADMTNMVAYKICTNLPAAVVSINAS
jgi:hypothetical protein